MGRFRYFLLLVFVAAAGILAGIGYKPCITLLAAPPAGADFQVSESDLSRPLLIIAYGDMRFTDPSETRQQIPKCGDGWWIKSPRKSPMPCC